VEKDEEGITMNALDLILIIVNSMIFFAIPLLVTALGGMFAEKSGVINIALEGTMIFGSFFSILFINWMQGIFPTINPSFLLLIAAVVAALFGSIISSLLALAAVQFKANQVIAGTAINLLAAPFVIFIARTLNEVKNIPFRNNFNIQHIPLLGDIPIIGNIFFQNVNALNFLGYAIAIASIVIIYSTRFGLRLSSVGENPSAADSVGIPVNRFRWIGTLISGSLAGIGGLTFVVASSVTFSGQVSGYGFLALAVMIFGQWKPEKIFLASMFFGLANAFSVKYTLIPWFDGISVGYFFSVLPYVATLIVLVLSSKKSRAPKAEGIPYEKGMR
jgi:simple sugar transport system permease protein